MAYLQVAGQMAQPQPGYVLHSVQDPYRLMWPRRCRDIAPLVSFSIAESQSAVICCQSPVHHFNINLGKRFDTQHVAYAQRAMLGSEN